MFYNKINSALEIKNKTNFVLLFSVIFLFFLSFNLFLNSKTSFLLQENSKKESLLNKVFALADNHTNAAISLEDIDLDNFFFISYKIFTYLQINSFDSRSILKDHQITIQFHLPLFLRYHALKIP
ncbi:hypothetical protein RC62_1077 [Flavobacterium aquidurense]|uniref:Uncharacterized protein n=1 Tax=Flavobacterium aquidurense TaxID=362413 RepID=A0A0N8VMI2_9FLAO|nr:hypothetical protein RC62_1077 [Flavobacterium aquidurense]